jgi:hypothetical protein
MDGISTGLRQKYTKELAILKIICAIKWHVMKRKLRLLLKQQRA